ncbi:MAG: type 4a pilus biogenesis protein PilO [Acidimicrobiales bacterium]
MKRITPALLVVALVVVIILAVPLRLALSHRTKLDAKAATINSKATAVGTKTAFARGVQANQAKWNSKAKTVAAAMPKGPGWADLIVQIGALAAADHVSWTSGSPSAPKTSGGKSAATGTTPYQLAMGVTGSRSDIEAFVAGLGHLHRLVSVSSVSITSVKTGTQATIDATAYSYVPTGAPA